MKNRIPGRALAGGRFGIGLALAVGGLFFGSAQAKTYYVATGGSDSAAGTNWTTAVKTIPVAVAKTALTGGDTVVVSNGTYTLTATLTVTNATLVSLNGYTNTFVRSTFRTHNPQFNLYAGAVVDGFTMKEYDGASSVGVAYIKGGTLQNCYIRGGSGINGNDGTYGAVSVDNNAIVRNCVIANHRGRFAGGAYVPGNGTIENCTLYGNTVYDTSTWVGGGLSFRYANVGTVRNCIVYGNVHSATDKHNYCGTAALFDYSCTTPSPGSAGIVTNPPMFVGVATGNYRLQFGSPCKNGGTNLLWTMQPGVVDLDGNGRIADSRVDIGAFEGTSTLGVTFTADDTEGFDPHRVVFTAVATGDTANVHYRWACTNTAVVDQQGVGRAVVTNVYPSGVFTPQVTVSNASGVVVSTLWPNYIRVGPATAYVAKVSTPAFPYDTWSKAANDIQTAVNAGVAGTVVLVETGTYVVASIPLKVTRGLTVKSRRGYARTILDANGAGGILLDIEHVDAVFDGFSLTGVKTATGVTAIELRSGALLNCWVHDLLGNYGAVRAGTKGKATVRNCLLTGNTGTYAGGVWIDVNPDTVVENCTIYGNVAKQTSASGTPWAGGLIFRSGVGQARNCIVYGNTNTANMVRTYDNWGGTYSTFTHSCTVPTPATIGMTGKNPQFKNAALRDFTLQPDSPCKNTGTSRPWIQEASATDIQNKPRLSGKGVDMGAFELQPFSTVLFIR